MLTKKIHILIAPLDWGIGHATRLVPVIRLLLQKGVDVTVAAGGRPLAFLKLNFPEVSFITSEGFKVVYPGKGSMAARMALSSPGLLSAIYRDHRQLEKIIMEYEIDGVISDNRFGFWSDLVPSVYITHQLVIRMPAGFDFLEPLSYRAHGHFIKKYGRCWIPDLPGDDNLSGDLSHKYTPPRQASYIGPLSRFREFATIDRSDSADSYDLLVMISGPEPQRSIMEKMVRRDLKKYPGRKVAMLQGLPGEQDLPEEHDGLKVFSHLPDHRMASLIRNAGRILCRPGYSTIMDLAALKKHAFVVPTPGQTEQEYLGSYLDNKGWHFCIRQQDLSLDKVFEARPEFRPYPDAQYVAMLEGQVDEFILELG